LSDLKGRMQELDFSGSSM